MEIDQLRPLDEVIAERAVAAVRRTAEWRALSRKMHYAREAAAARSRAQAVRREKERNQMDAYREQYQRERAEALRESAALNRQIAELRAEMARGERSRDPDADLAARRVLVRNKEAAVSRRAVEVAEEHGLDYRTARESVGDVDYLSAGTPAAQSPAAPAHSIAPLVASHTGPTPLARLSGDANLSARAVEMAQAEGISYQAARARLLAGGDDAVNVRQSNDAVRQARERAHHDRVKMAYAGGAAIERLAARRGR